MYFFTLFSRLILSKNFGYLKQFHFEVMAYIIEDIYLKGGIDYLVFNVFIASLKVHFPVFNYKRHPNLAITPVNIFAMAFGLYMIDATMMDWVDYNSPT